MSELHLPVIANEAAIVPEQKALADASIIGKILAGLSRLVLLVILVLAVITLVRSPPSALR